MNKNDVSKDINCNINIENGVSTKITGVNDVVSYNPIEIILNTDLGMLIIKGENFSIDKLDVENNILSFKGLVAALFYNKNKKNENNILKKLLK